MATDYNIFQKHLLLIKQGYANLVEKLVTSYAYNKCDIKSLETKVKILSSYLNIFNCYDYSLFAYKYEFTCSTPSDIGTFNTTVATSNVGGGSTSFGLSNASFFPTSPITLTQLLDKYVVFIGANAFPVYTITKKGNALYIYSVDTTFEFPPVSGSVGITATSDLACVATELEPNWLDYESELCPMIQHAYDLLSGEKIIAGCNCA